MSQPDFTEFVTFTRIIEGGADPCDTCKHNGTAGFPCFDCCEHTSYYDGPLRPDQLGHAKWLASEPHKLSDKG